MPNYTSIVSIKQYEKVIGVVTVCGTLFLTEPRECTFTQGTVTVRGFVQAAFAALVDGNPVKISISIRQVFEIRFVLDLQEFVGQICEVDDRGQILPSTSSHRLVSLFGP